MRGTTQQRCGSVPERLMGKPADDGVAHDAFTAAGPTPPIECKDAALDDRPIRAEVLPDGFQA